MRNFTGDATAGRDRGGGIFWVHLGIVKKILAHLFPASTQLNPKANPTRRTGQGAMWTKA